MNNPTYLERVQAIAKEISEKNNHKKWGPGLPDWNKSMEQARNTVKYMADAVKEAITELQDDSCEYSIRGYCIAHGLIPDSGRETDKPEPCPPELRCFTRDHTQGTCECYNRGLIPRQEVYKP
jgi:hypothetical protein